MNRSPDKRQVNQLHEQAEKIGSLLGLEKVPTYNMAWKEPRLELAGGGECYPLLSVLEKLAEMANIPVVEKPKRKRKVKTGEVDKIDGTTEV